MRNLIVPGLVTPRYIFHEYCYAEFLGTATSVSLKYDTELNINSAFGGGLPITISTSCRLVRIACDCRHNSPGTDYADWTFGVHKNNTAASTATATASINMLDGDLAQNLTPNVDHSAEFSEVVELSPGDFLSLSFAGAELDIIVGRFTLEFEVL